MNSGAANTHDAPAIWKSGLILAVMAAVCTGLVAVTYHQTAPRIAANERAYLEQSLQPALAGISYDSNVADSAFTIPDPHELPGNEPVTVYRAFQSGEPVAALFVVTAPDGFSGPIRLLVGVAADGTVSGVRVLQHKETPGLGEFIDQSRSDWILQFAGTSLRDPAPAMWAIRRDAGAFDQLTGASVTPRAVVKAVKETLLYFEANRDSVFSTENPGTSDTHE